MFEKLDIHGHEEEFYKFTKIKSKFLYFQFYEVFSENIENLKYELIASCIKYDKNLRDVLYIWQHLKNI